MRADDALFSGRRSACEDGAALSNERRLHFQWIGEDTWPTVGEAIQELRDWYYANREELPRPDEYAEPLVRRPRILENP